MSDDEKITISLSEAALMLGNGVTPENVHGRIRQGGVIEIVTFPFLGEGWKKP